MESPDIVRPEWNLLLACARAQLDAEAKTHLHRILSSSLDWKYAIGLARKHALLPLIHKHLKEAQSGYVPESVMAYLEQMSLKIARSNLRMTAELFRIIHALETEGAPAIAIKGPALAQSLYGSISLRQFGDLDLLISPADTVCAVRVMQSLGYQCDFDYSETEHDIHLNAYYNFSFVSLETGIRVEIHHRLSLPCFQSEEQVKAILSRAQEIVLAGKKVRVLSPEDQITYLCAHGVKHIWERLEWICAISEIMRGDMISDWSLAASQARASGDERTVLIGMLLAESLVGARIPSAMEAAAHRDQTAQKLAAQARRRLLQETASPETGENFFYTLHAHYLRARIVYCWFSLTTPSLADITLLRLPRPFYSLYAFSRPLRVITTYATSVSRALFAR